MVTFTVKQEASGGRIWGSFCVFLAMKDLVKSDQESFWILGCDNVNREILRQCIFVGGRHNCSIDVPLVIKRLLAAGVSSWFAIHNHPSGIPEPSEDDKKITSRLYVASKVACLSFLDHIIIAGNDIKGGYFSFADHGMMDRIKNCYEPDLFLLLDQQGIFDTHWKPNKLQYLRKAVAFDQIYELVKEKNVPGIIIKNIKKILRKVDRELKNDNCGRGLSNVKKREHKKIATSVGN